MQPDLWSLYGHMFRSRLFEEAVARFWEEGRISGEMHLGIGEEAIAAGVVAQLEEGDAMALDHRATPPLLMRGADPVLILREFLGCPDGLCSGMGGHMHLFSPQHLAASSGIVGASGPTAVGFALAAQFLRPGTMAVAFFGEGATNQGMLMEAMNLAVVWNLPVLFVCKDNGWAVTTLSPSVTAGRLVDRAKSFGFYTVEADGSDVEAVWHVARQAMERSRRGDGPGFLHVSCVRPYGYLLGDKLLRIARRPVGEMGPMAGPLLRALTSVKGASIRDRLQSLRSTLSRIVKAAQARSSRQPDPLRRARRKLQSDQERLGELEEDIRREIQQIVEAALLPGEEKRGEQ